MIDQLLLPSIRHDIKLLETTPAEDGSKQWLIYDSIQNRYFTIGIDTFEILHHWQDNLTYEAFLQYLKSHDYETDIESIHTLVSFLQGNNLVKTITFNDTKQLLLKKQQMKQSWWKWLIHNYLFVKIPLFKPDKWLTKNYHRISFMYSDLWQYFLIIIGLIGLINVLKEFEIFKSTFLYFFSIEGFFYYAISLIFVKSIHELSHAFTAKRNGCKIPSIGVAFLVMMPVLYTDTTNAYQLTSKKKRLDIALAGIKAEVYLAMIATFAWSFLDPGPLKSIAFTTATTSLIASLLINISPFMRFDGYYALSDMTDTKNLQPRSFAYTKWFLRKYLIGIQEESPELILGQKKNFFIFYALSTWLYRLILFIGIALLVYYFAFKVLGIILFLIEIFWFILLPIFSEFKVWFLKRRLININKNNISFLFAIAAVTALFFIPWYSKIHLPAIIMPLEYVDIYATKSAVIEKIYVEDKDTVAKNDILLQLNSTEIDLRILQLKNELDSLRSNLNLIAGNKKIRLKRFAIEQSINKTKNELEGLYKAKKTLIVRAPFDGKVKFEIKPQIGQWVNKQEPIFSVYNPKTISIIAFCKEDEIKRLNHNDKALFIANNGEMRTMSSSIQTISNTSSSIIMYPELSSVYDGKIATRQTNINNQTNLISEYAYFKVIASFDENNTEKLNLQNSIKFRLTGDLIVHGKSESFYDKIRNEAVRFLVKESGF